ncbi:hypothetical protein EYZ11_012626 [Aspergillus tanneri]|uniref:Uncharacterized protein n=1 Tax=Aspergillus tanneri TaxID=1220188 RepID=A0A4S3J1W2_9EURO|nr:hypothetical protein EYZ11_012626 [Aspergillus tanneri]
MDQLRKLTFFLVDARGETHELQTAPVAAACRGDPSEIRGNESLTTEAYQGEDPYKEDHTMLPLPGSHEKARKRVRFLETGGGDPHQERKKRRRLQARPVGLRQKAEKGAAQEFVQPYRRTARPALVPQSGQDSRQLVSSLNNNEDLAQQPNDATRQFSQRLAPFAERPLQADPWKLTAMLVRLEAASDEECWQFQDCGVPELLQRLRFRILPDDEAYCFTSRLDQLLNRFSSA